MKIAIFGGSGRTGQEIIRALTASGHDISGLVRKPGALMDSRINKEKVTEIVGDFADESAIDKTIVGSDAVIIVIGPRPPYTDIFTADATSKIIKSMKRHKVKRLFCQTGAMIGNSSDNLGLFYRSIKKSQESSNLKMMDDRAMQEKLVRNSGLDWTIIKPPRITDGKTVSKYSAGPDIRIGLMSSVSRGTIAKFISDELEEGYFVGERVFIKG